MATLNPSSLSAEKLYENLFILQVTLKVSHFSTRVLAQHEGFGNIYDALNPLLDKMIEQIVGYSEEPPKRVNMDVTSVGIHTLAKNIMNTAEQCINFARLKKYYNIENLGQELSGLGAHLNYLARFDRAS